MRRWAWTAVVVLAACAPVDAPRQDRTSPPAVSLPPPPPPPPPEPPDYCGARALEYLIGQHRSQIPVPIDLSSRRVTCTTCPVTQDYSPYRVNILFDQDTGIVQEVKCG